MKAPSCLLLLILLAGSAAAQSSGTASKLIGDAFKTSLTKLEPIPEDDRAAVIAFTKHLMGRLVTFREDGTAATTHYLGKSETHIEWRGLNIASVRADHVTDADRANGVSRKYSVGLACETHRTWDRTKGRWSDWRSSGYILFPSVLHIRIRNGAMEVANTFHGTFGRGPGSPVSMAGVTPKPSHQVAPPSPPRHSRPMPSGTKVIESAPVPVPAPQTGFLQPLFHALLPSIPLLAIGVGLFVLVKIFASAGRNPRSKGWLGERRVRNLLSTLDPSLYHSHHDLYLPRHDGAGLTQIDHVVVSPYGIFVVETKNFSGWIFGSENQPTWTQQIYRRKSSFPNPLHQNNLHVNSLAAHLGLGKDRFHSLVFFAGNAIFKTPMPGNVLSQGLTRRILTRNTMLLTPPELAAARARLAELDHTTDRKAASRTHLAALRARHC